MENIIINLLKHNHFDCINTDLNLYTNQLKSEYFMVRQYSQEELNDFFENDKTSKIIDEFEKQSRTQRHDNIKKNTSLFILVEVEDLKTAFEDDKTQRSILLVEEDYYYFRKFVLLYTSEGISDLEDKATNDALYNYLESNIDTFEDNMFFSDSYFMAMEIGVKLPFFTLPEKDDIFQSIEKQYHDSMDELDNRLRDFYNKYSDDELSNSLKNIAQEDESISELLQIGELLL